MQNIAIAIITIIIVSIIVCAIGRITIIISDCILVKQQNKQMPIHEAIQQAAKKQHSAFDYGVMGFITAVAIALSLMILWMIGAVVHSFL